MKDTAWLEQVNREYPCPCYANDTGYQLISANPKNAAFEWGVDKDCAREGKGTYQSLELDGIQIITGFDCDNGMYNDIQN